MTVHDTSSCHSNRRMFLHLCRDGWQSMENVSTDKSSTFLVSLVLCLSIWFGNCMKCKCMLKYCTDSSLKSCQFVQKGVIMSPKAEHSSLNSISSCSFVRLINISRAACNKRQNISHYSFKLKRRYLVRVRSFRDCSLRLQAENI